MRRSILYFASWRLVIASSCCVAMRGSRPPLSRHAGTDRFWPKRRAKPRVAKRCASRKGPRNAGVLGGSSTEVKPCPGRAKARPGTGLPGLLVDVDFDRTGEERAPGPQIGLYMGIAGDPLAVELDHLGRVVFDLVDEPRRVVHVQQQAYPPAAEGLVERLGGIQQRRKVAGIRRRQSELELHGASDRLALSFIRHCLTPSNRPAAPLDAIHPGRNAPAPRPAAPRELGPK